MARRKSLKGAGADLFLAGQTAPRTSGKPASQQTIKVSYRLPSDVVHGIEDLWMDLRRTSRTKLTKEQVVVEALRKGLAEGDDLRKALV